GPVNAASSGGTGGLPTSARGDWYLHDVRTRSLAPSPLWREGWGEGERANAGTPGPRPPHPRPLSPLGRGEWVSRTLVTLWKHARLEQNTLSATLLERCVDT